MNPQKGSLDPQNETRNSDAEHTKVHHHDQFTANCRESAHQSQKIKS